VKYMVSFDQERMLKPAVIGGIINGILGAICCLCYVIGGAVAAHLYVNAGGICDYENCGLVGAISGVIGGVIASILSFLFMSAYLSALGLKAAMFTGASFIIGFITAIIFGAILGAVGGVIYVVIKNR